MYKDNDLYLTIEHISEGFYKEKGSTFTAFAIPVKNEEDIRNALEELKRRYHDARHLCYAYVLGRRGEIQKAHDAGEPPYTAGEPILRQIRSRNLSFVLVAVVRYFGGTKLGTGGLIQAYKTTAASALECNTFIRPVSMAQIAVTLPPKDLGPITDLFLKEGGKITEQHFGEEYRAIFEVPLEKADALSVKLQKVGVAFEIKDQFPES